MKFALIFLLALVACVLSQEYTNRFDNIDLEAVIKNDRLLKNYVDCLMDRGKCTKEGTELKKRIPDALENGCTKCTERQLAGVRRVIKYLVENKKDVWNELVQKYDPNGVYKRKYAELSRKENVTV